MEIAVIALLVLVGLLGGWIFIPKKKKPISFEDWSEIYFEGYNSGITGVADLLESFAFDEATRKTALRWSGLVRQLQQGKRGQS